MGISLDRLLKRYKNRNKSKLKTKTFNYPEDTAGFTMSDKDIIMGVGSPEEFIIGSLIQNRYKENKEIHHNKTKIISSKKEWNEFSKEHFPNYRQIQFKDYAGWLFNDSLDSCIEYRISGDSFSIDIIGDFDFVNNNKQIIESNFQVVQSYIKWIHSSDGDYITTTLNDDMLPIDGMYPFLKDESLEDYYSRYLKSTASILLLIGPPGTGKTTFLRGLLNYAKTSAIVTYDPEILQKDRVFADFLEDDECSIMILEDSDAFLSARTTGNTMMHRFLNVSNGLVTAKGKKMIFSTNLPSIRDIDPALTRPGRCFDIVKFDELTKDQATSLANKIDIILTQDKTSYTIAEIFHEMNIKPVTKFGFNQ